MSNDGYLALFLSEAEEILTAINENISALEKDANNKSILQELFRNFHTLKGNAAAMGYSRIEKLAHILESLLDKLRSEKLTFTPEIGAYLFQGLDLLSLLIDGLQDKAVQVDENSFIEAINNLAETPIKKKLVSPVKSVPIEKNPEILSNIKSVRVNLTHIEALMNAIGQLHISKIGLVELSKQRNDAILTQAIHELEQTVNQLQEQIMQIRLLPLKYLFNNFPRLVREDARREEKNVELTISGGEIGLDRTVLDEIYDPLIHILRNAVTHGIEAPDERQSLGKPVAGHISIEARQEQNTVVIKIEDDGYGLDAEKIKKGILRHGLISAEALERLSEQELLLLITLPGFSLREKVTESAGRGVGMNVVKNKIESIGGSLTIQSKLGQGTTFLLRLPISVAIIYALLVHINKEIYAIPLYTIIEAIKLNTRLIKKVSRQEIISYRDEVIPLIRWLSL